MIRPCETAEPEAAANAGWRWQFRFRGLRPWSGVAELGSLDRMRKITAILGTALICVTGSVATTFAQTPVPPKNGYVPDAATAIKIAVAVWNQFYGERQIADEKPYRATLKDGVWTVEGSMPPNLIEIAKSDGRILRVEHGE